MTYEYITKYNSPNYSQGRPFGPPNSITIHWWDDPKLNPTFQGTIDYLCRKRTPGTSAHYVAEAGRVACLVAPGDRAWHARTEGNKRSIGIECNPRMSDGDKETVAELIAALRKTYGDLPLKAHSDWVATTCPGVWKAQLGWLDRRARELMGGAAPAPTPAPAPQPAPSGDIDALAQAVIAGKYGSGDARKRALGAQYAAVQARVNEILGAKKGGTVPKTSPSIDALAQAVIRGEYGSGDERKRKLGSQYAAVQARVNEILGAKGAAAGPSIDDLARAVIRGEYGTGAERKRRLGSRYAAVQARVNQMLR